MLIIQRLLILYGIILCAEGARTCPDKATKAHLTRCDMYYRCKVMESDNIIWSAKNCPNGLVYDVNYGYCVLPGDDWECQLETESRSSSADDDNVYGVNNLSYLKEQVKGYDADGDKTDEEDEEELNDDDDNENVLITMTNNGTMSFESSAYSNSSENEIESSGDGEDEDDLENKSSYISIPNNSDGLVSSQLQRLSQLVRKVNNNQHSDLTPDDLNQYLSLHKLVHQKYPSNTKAEPVPHNKLIEEHHLKQILDLQKRLNNLANTRNTYSTPPTPVKFTVTGNGVYPADATTVHIKATNALKNPRFPDGGHSTSQIVVNRPGGSVVFRLPHSDYPTTKKPSKKKPENHISENTLKTLLELTKNMANQAPNTPNFVHSLEPSNSYAQPIIQPVLYNFPWDKLPMSSLFGALTSQKFDKTQNDDVSMEKISSVRVSVPTTPNESSEPDDTGPTTIIHNHVPITIAHPSPSNSIVNRYHVTASTTPRPIDDRYDSYGNKKPDHTDLNNYYPYPPFSENQQKNPSFIEKRPSVVSTMPTYYTSPFSTQQTSYNANVEQPQYIQIAQSQPDRYIPVYPTNTIVSNAMRPIPTFASIDGGYTQKFFSAYTQQPHIGENNVNEIVHINQKPPYPTLRPVNYVPIATASSPTPSYADPPESFGQYHKHPLIADKIDHFIDSNEPSDGGSSNNANNDQYENNDDYVNTNVEQNSNENVMDVLANYNFHKKTNSMESIGSMGGGGSSSSSNVGVDSQIITNIGGEKKPSNKYKPTQIQGNHKQFVNLNGNFMSLETYQQTIEPYLQKNSALSSQIEVLTCATGVRQANSTDCTRYFVCNEKTGKILSYSCPPYTAFSGETKICTADTYAKCYVGDLNQIDSKFSPQMSMMEAHRIKSEAVKAQQLAHLIKLETNKILSAAHQVRYKQQTNGGKSTTQMVQQTPTRPSKIGQQPVYRKPQINQTPVTPPQRQNVKNGQSKKKPQGKRKVPCRTEGKLVDNLSQYHYFLCFKDQQQKMRARRLQCPAKLTFCPSSLVCTSIERCSKIQ
ncbi:uncharacterized protein LOC116340991 [Contarinia nasturtii]|uniref:uncharacterized protein LOC116340991 n=1 Tax=Contarinia nasturtii TaxID=265458 RepID=UPI0012D476C8|nr:uncharacterized protein LOC116340991 [Contarinia nasturtii]